MHTGEIRSVNHNQGAMGGDLFRGFDEFDFSFFSSKGTVKSHGRGALKGYGQLRRVLGKSILQSLGKLRSPLTWNVKIELLGHIKASKCSSAWGRFTLPKPILKEFMVRAWGKSP